jgi:hypothetical protein
MGLTALVSRLFLATLILLYIGLSLLVWIATGQVKSTPLAPPSLSLARSRVCVAKGAVKWSAHRGERRRRTEEGVECALEPPLELQVAVSSPLLPTPHTSPLLFKHCLFQQLMCPRVINV